MFDIADYIGDSSIIWSSIVTTLGCVVLGKYLTKKSGVSGDFNRYKFLYHVMPRSPVFLVFAELYSFVFVHHTGNDCRNLASFYVIISCLFTIIY